MAVSPTRPMQLSLAFRASCASIASVGLFFLSVASAAALAPTATGGPGDGQTFVPIEAFINREFDGALSGATINMDNVKLQANTGNAQGGAPDGSNLCTMLKIFITASPKEMVVCEHANLAAETWYTFTLTTGIRSADNL